VSPASSLALRLVTVVHEEPCGGDGDSLCRIQFLAFRRFFPAICERRSFNVVPNEGVTEFFSSPIWPPSSCDCLLEPFFFFQAVACDGRCSFMAFISFSQKLYVEMMPAVSAS